MADLLHTNPSDWKYVSEGGATIVFSYTGPPHSKFDGTVLRLRKISAAMSRPQSDGESDDNERDDPSVEYQRKCMERLIPPQYLPRLETVGLDRPWLKALVALRDSVRPEERRERDGIDMERKKGVLATDLVGGNWLAVEIKPKWAFLPSPVHLSEATKLTKLRTCRFCMHSYSKSHEGHQAASEYCPLDLFSGDETRMVKAIHALWGGWISSNGTANNLKIFSRGKFLKPSEAHFMLADNSNPEGLATTCDLFAKSLIRPLIATPVLRMLSDLQRDLDMLDIEGLSKLWRLTELSAPLYQKNFASILVQSPEISSSTLPCTPIGESSRFINSPEPTMSDWVDFLDTYLSTAKPELDHFNPLPENLRYYLLAYLLSATFKDCSIIVRLEFLQPTQEMAPDSVAPVAVIDLDPKRMGKLKDWEKLDMKIVNTYASSGNGKVCVS